MRYEFCLYVFLFTELFHHFLTTYHDLVSLYLLPCAQFPGLNQANFLTEVLKKRYGEFDYDNDVLQGYSANRFVLGDVMMADMNTWAVGVVSDYNFYLKWQFGRPRPEVSGRY